MRRNKKDYLIVDGYNIINAWDELKEIAISDLEHAREKLIDAIIEYAEFTGRLGIIVFDAYNIKSCKEKIEKRKNITIVYTKEYQTADSYIEKFIGSLSKYDDVKVATNDYAEQQIVLGKGASRITSRELKLDLENAKSKIREKNEYDIVLKASKGDKIALEYIIKKYKNFVKAKAKSYFLIGADKEDIIQEGMIGLYKAVRDFDASKTNSFKGFADICITRQIITAIKTATRQKHIPLNSYISLNKPVYDEESERTLLDIIATSIVTDPEELIISKEELKHIESKMNELLSDLELQVVEYYLNGKSYQYIADKLKRDVKSIDNALQRVKRKLEKHLENRND